MAVKWVAVVDKFAERKVNNEDRFAIGMLRTLVIEILIQHVKDSLAEDVHGQTPQSLEHV